MYAWFYFWAVYSNPWIKVYFNEHHTVLNTTALSYNLKLEYVKTPALFFPLKIPLALQDLLWFHAHFRIICLFMRKMPLKFWICRSFDRDIWVTLLAFFPRGGIMICYGISDLSNLLYIMLAYLHLCTFSHLLSAMLQRDYPYRGRHVRIWASIRINEQVLLRVN